MLHALSARACPPIVPAETAARDRLGKGHKIEIQPLSSILGRIKQRQALAIARWGDNAVWGAASCMPCLQCPVVGGMQLARHRQRLTGQSCHCCPLACAVCRAPKAALPDVGNFDDILAQARQGAAADAGHPAAPGAGEEQAGGGADGGEAQAEGGSQGSEGGSEGGDGDLQILSSDEEEGGEGGGELRLVELPSTVKKKRMPFIPTQVPASAYPACLAIAGWVAVVPLPACLRCLQRLARLLAWPAPKRAMCCAVLCCAAGGHF